jgi:peroxiredoxin family protein
MESKERMTIILHSGSYDRAAYALTMALVALASEMEAHMLLTFAGLKRFTKGHLSNMGDETSIAIKTEIERGIEWGIIPTLDSQLAEAKKLGLKLYACPNAIASLNIPQNELLDEIDGIMGLAAFFKLVRTAVANWYI